MNKETLDNNNILIFAFRYALGRMSTAPEIVTEELKKHWSNFPASTQAQIKREIQAAIDKDRAGMDCDVQTWMRVLEL